MDAKLWGGDQELNTQNKPKKSWWDDAFTNAEAYVKAAYANTRELGMGSDIKQTFDKIYNRQYSDSDEKAQLIADLNRLQSERKEYRDMFQQNQEMLNQNDSMLKDYTEVGGTLQGVGTQAKDTAIGFGAGAAVGSVVPVLGTSAGAMTGAKWGNRIGAIHQAINDADMNAIDAWEKVLNEGGTPDQAEQAYKDAFWMNLPTEASDIISSMYFGGKLTGAAGNILNRALGGRLAGTLAKGASKVSRFDLPARIGTYVANKSGQAWLGQGVGIGLSSIGNGLEERVQEPWQDYATERAVDIQRRQYDPTNKLNKDVRDFSVLGEGGLLDYYTTPEGMETGWKAQKMGMLFGGASGLMTKSQFTELGTAHSDSIQSAKREADWIDKQGLLKDEGNLERYNNVKETMANMYDLSEDEKADLSVEDVARMYHEYYTNLFGQGGNRQEQNAVSQADFLNEITGEETARRGLMGDTATKYIDEFGIRPDNETLVGINDNQQVLSEEQVQQTLEQDGQETAEEGTENKEGIKAKTTDGTINNKVGSYIKERTGENGEQVQQKKGGLREQYGKWKRVDEGEDYDYSYESKYRNEDTGRVARVTKVNGGYTITDITDKEEGTPTIAKTLKDVTKFLGKKANQKTKFMSDGTQEQEQVSQALPKEDGVISEINSDKITEDAEKNQWFNGKKIQSNKAQTIHSMQDLHDYYKTHKDLMSKDLYAEISRQMMRFGIGNANNTEIVLDLTNREAGGFGSETTIRTDPNDENSAVAKAIVRLYAGADLATAAHEMAHLGWMNLSDQDRATFTKWAEKTQGEFIAKILGMDYDQNFRSYLIEALTNRESQTSQDLWAKIKREGAVQQTLGILNGQNYGLAVEERFAWEFSNWYAQGYIKGAKPRNIIERILNKACATLQGALNLLSDTNRYLNGENGYNGGDINSIFTNMSTRGIGQQRQTVAPQEQVETVTRMDYAPETGYDLAQGLPNVADSELGFNLDEEPEQNLSGNYGTTRVNQKAEKTAQQKTKTGYGEGVANNNETLGQYRERMKQEAEQKKEEKKQNYTPTTQYKPKERSRKVGGYEQTSPQGETLEQYKQREAEEAEKYKVPTSLKGVRKLLTIVKNRKEGWQRALQSLKQIDPRKFRSIKTQIGNDLWGVNEEQVVSDGNDLWGQPQQQSLFGKEFEETKSEPQTQVEENTEETKKTNTVEEPSLFENQTEQVSEETDQGGKTPNKSVENLNLTTENQGGTIEENPTGTEKNQTEEVAESGETENTRGTENLQGNVGEVQRGGGVRQGNDNRTGEGRVGQNSVEERSEGNGKDISLLKNSKFKSVYNARKEKKTEVKDWRDLSDSDQAKQVYVDALNASKEANKDYGVYVSEQTVESLKDCKVVLHKNKMAGFAITPDGNIVGVFSNPKNPIRGILNDMIFIAHMMGGNSMDCFGSFLLHGYRACGFTPVARTTFDEAYYPADNPANATIRKEKPDVFFLVKDNDNNTTYLNKMNNGEYENDQIEIDSIPLIDSEDSYGDALGFQGQVLEEIQKKDNKGKSTKEVADSLRPKEETTTETQETAEQTQNNQTESQGETTEQVQEEDDNYNRALERVTKNGKTSVSDLKSSLNVPFKEALELIKRLEENNVISGAFEETQERRLVPEEDRQYPEYIAWVRDKETKKYDYLRYHYPTKAAFLKDLHGNGYTVYYIATKETLDEESDKFNKKQEENRSRSKYRSRAKRESAKFNKELEKKSQERQEYLDSLSPEEREKEIEKETEETEKRIQEYEEAQKKDPFNSYRNTDGEIHNDKEGVHHKADEVIPDLPFKENGENNPQTGSEYIKRITRKYATSNKILANLKASLKHALSDKDANGYYLGVNPFDKEFLQDAYDTIDQIQMLRSKKKGTGTIKPENNECPWTSRMIYYNLLDQAHDNLHKEQPTENKSETETQVQNSQVEQPVATKSEPVETETPTEQVQQKEPVKSKKPKKKGLDNVIYAEYITGYGYQFTYDDYTTKKATQAEYDKYRKKQDEIREQEEAEKEKKRAERKKNMPEDRWGKYRDKDGVIESSSEGVFHEQGDEIADPIFDIYDDPDSVIDAKDYIEALVSYEPSGAILSNLKKKINTYWSSKNPVGDMEYWDNAVEAIEEEQERRKDNDDYVSSDDNQSPWTSRMIMDNMKEHAEYLQKQNEEETETEQQTSPQTETATEEKPSEKEKPKTTPQTETTTETKQTTIDKSDKNYQKAVELVIKNRGMSATGLRLTLKDEGIVVGQEKAEQYLVQMENDGIVEHGDEGSLRLLKKNPSTKMQEAGQNAENQTLLNPQVEEELENLFWKLIRKKQFHGMDSRWASGSLDYYKSLSNRRQGKEFNPEFIKGDKAFLNAIKNVNDYIHEKFPQYKNVYRGVDGHWRFEFSDKDAHFINGFEKLSGKTLDTTLDKILKHDNLYKFYSKLKGMPVHLVRNTKMQEIMEDTENQYYAMYDPDEKAIYINSDMFESNNELRNSLLHEIQHAIQDIEGFANGTNDNAYNNDYDFSEGEKQAVLTEKRSNMSDEELEKNPRYETLNPEEKTVMSEQRPIKKAAKKGQEMLNKSFPNTKFQWIGDDAWHSSPYDFDEFTLSKIGAGEGYQTHGHGIYLQKSLLMNKRYLDKFLEKSINDVVYRASVAFDRMNKGLPVYERDDSATIYHVQVPNESNMLNEWETFPQHSKNMQNRILRAAKDIWNYIPIEEKDPIIKRLKQNGNEKVYREYLEFAKKQDGNKFKEFINVLKKGEQYPDVYRYLVETLDSFYKNGEIYNDDNTQQIVSETLNKYGIQGIHYIGEQDGECYVVFNPDALNILDKLKIDKDGNKTYTGIKDIKKNEEKIQQENERIRKRAIEKKQNKNYQQTSNTKMQSSGNQNTQTKYGYIDKQKDIYSVTFTKSAQKNGENQKKIAFYRKNKSYWRENKDAQTGSITFTRALPYQQHQKTIIYDEINGKKVGKRKKAKWREYYEAFKDHMIKWLFNDKHFLEKAARNVGAIESYMRMMVMKDQGAVAGAAIEDGIVKHNGKNGERTKSLNSIIEAVGEENQKDFLDYCEAYRVLDLEKRNIYQKMTPDKAREKIAKVKRSKNAKLFEQQRQNFVEYNHELLWVLVDGGFITEKQYDKFIANDPNFIPLAKNMDELEGYVDGFKDSKTMINVAHPMHKIGTSMREVANPFLEMQKRTVEYYVKASRNKAGHIFVHDIAEAIAQNAKGDVVAQNQGMVRKLASRDKNGKPISHDNKQYVFYVWENGEKQYYQVADREIYVALKSFDAEQMGALSKIMNATAGKASRLVRNTATMTPDFGLRNLVRDNMEAFISSEHGFLPLVDSLWGMYQMANDTQWFKEYQRMNGDHLSLNRDGEDVATVEHDIKDNVKFYKTIVPLFKKDLHEFMDKDRSMPARAKSLLKLVAIDIVPLQSIYKANKRLNDYLETGTRIGEYRNARMGYKGLKGRLFETSGSTIWTTDMDLSRAKNTEMIAAYKSKDITLNFGQHGVLGKELNRYIPFFNASLQGIYKLGNTLDDMIHAEDARRRQELMFKCALMGAMGMAAALAGQGDDDYDEAPDYEHENFWILPNGIRIPKDQLFGKLIGGTVEKATAQYLKDGDVKKLELVQDILGNFAIDKCVPALVDLGWGTIGNYDSFKKKSVTPEYMADKLGYLQKDLSTSKAGADISETIYKVTDGLFKALGYNSGGVDIGAKKVDFVISKTLSNLGKYATSLWELTGGNEKMTRGAEVEDKGGFAETSKELPYPLNQVVGTFATNRNSFQSISDFYERHRELKKLSSDESIMSKNEKKAWEAYQAAYKKDKQYRDALKAIKLDKSLTGAQKRQKADKIFKQQISMARKLHDWEKKHGLV